MDYLKLYPFESLLDSNKALELPDELIWIMIRTYPAFSSGVVIII